MTYGLYYGIGLRSNFIKFKNFNTGDYIPGSGNIPDIDIPTIDTGDGISGFILSILLWVGMAILFLLLLIVLEFVFWFSVFILFAMLYWIFIRALKFVFSKSKDTKGDIAISAIYSFGYTIMYLGWLFIIVYLADFFR